MEDNYILIALGCSFNGFICYFRT